MPASNSTPLALARLKSSLGASKDDWSMVRTQAVSSFGGILADWRAHGQLALDGMVRIVVDWLKRVPGGRTPLPDLRVMADYSIAHPLNMLGYCLQVGKAMGLPEDRLRMLGLATLAHDFGKEVPTGHPRTEVFRHADEHCETGFQLLRELAPDFPQTAALAVREHHERVDGRGPLKQTEFCDLAAIIGLCDLYDARVTAHAQRGATSPHVAHEIAISMLSLFPYEVATAFQQVIVPYPVNSKVFLMDGQIGSVLALNPEDATRPVITIGAKRVDLLKGSLRVVDLARAPVNG